MTANDNLPRLVKGTFDTTGAEARRRRYVVDTIRDAARRYGYPEMETPAIYYTDILAAKFEETSELADEMYRLTDRGRRDLALRYDLTVPFARYVAENAKRLSFPFARFECGEVFRDGPVKSGRTRQFCQCDLDVVGDDDEAATAYQQISCALSVFERLGIPVSVRYSSRKFVNGVLALAGVAQDKQGNVVRIIDKKDKMCDKDFLIALYEEGLELSQVDTIVEWLNYSSFDLRKFMADISILDIEPDEFPEDLLAGISEIMQFERYLTQDVRAKNACELAGWLVRGQDYYTGLVFEFYTDNFSSSIAAGGRYGNIVEKLGGAAAGDTSLSGSGLSFGIVPICEVLRQCEGNEIENAREGVIILPVDKADAEYACVFATQLREKMAVDVDTSVRNVSKKMKSANKNGYRFVIVYGENEQRADKVSVKDMETGSVWNIEKDALCMLNEEDLVEMLGGAED